MLEEIIKNRPPRHFYLDLYTSFFKSYMVILLNLIYNLRVFLLIFSYQLRNIGVGRHSMGKRVKAVKPELERYAGLVQQIKDKSKERKALPLTR